jgi:GNAT superfamily N-acetyltransferase
MPVYAPPRIPPRVKQLTQADLADALALQAAVAAGLPAHFIRVRSEDELRGYLNGRLGVAFGIFDRDVLLATALLRLPSPDHPNPQSDPPFPLVPAADWPCHAAFLENAMVLPAARGRGFQRALLLLRLAHAAVSGMKWVCAGANLRNEASWRNLLAEEMAIVGLIDRGFPAIGLLAAFDADALATVADDRLAVPAQDQAGHQAALRDFYVGVGLAPEGTVIYRRLSAHGSRRAA